MLSDTTRNILCLCHDVLSDMRRDTLSVREWRVCDATYCVSVMTPLMVANALLVSLIGYCLKLLVYAA